MSPISFLTNGPRFDRLFIARRARWPKGLAMALAVLGLAAAHAGELSLSWQDNSDNEEGFEIERALLGESFGLLGSVGPDVQTYVDESIVPGLEYEYRVRAFNAFGYSGYSNVSVGMMPNTPPVIGAIASFSVLEGEVMEPVSFDFSDAESPASELFVEALSSNLSLFPLEAISIELDGVTGKGTVLVEPRAGATGSASLTVLLSDGVETVQTVFLVGVRKNLAPNAVGTLAGVQLHAGEQGGAIAFSVSDPDSSSDALVVTGSSLDESLVSSQSVVIAGSGGERTVSFTANSGVVGSTSIRLEISDGVSVSYGWLPVTVLPPNEAPEIAGLDALYTVGSGSQLKGIAFSVSDGETLASDLMVSISSTNTMLVGPSGLILSGSGSQRYLDVVPNPGVSGSTEVTVSVSDGVRSTSYRFTLRILPAEAEVRVLGFRIEEGHAVLEVENRMGASFSLWKVHGRNGGWLAVQDAEIVSGSASTTLIDPTPVDSAVCYRVIASE